MWPRARRAAALAFAAACSLPLRLAAGEPPPVAVGIELEGSAPGKGAARARLLVEDPSGRRPSIERDVTVPGKELLSLAAGSRWRLSLAGGCCWTPPRTIAAEAGPLEVRLPAVPAGTAVGRVALPRGEPAPRALTVVLLPSRQDRLPAGSAGAETECPVRDGRWACHLPAAVLDARFRAPGFLSVYRWGLRVERGGTVDLGTLDLRRGAGLAGWVRTEDGGPLGEAGRVELDVPAVWADDPAEAERKPLRAVATDVLPNGFFAFQGIPPGTYALTARHPDYAPATVQPPVVRESSETELPDYVLLARPLDLTVHVDPVSDERGRPWKVTARSRDPVDGRWTEVPLAGVEEEPGTYRGLRLAPGPYQVEVGNAERERVASEEVVLARGSDTVTVRVGLLRLRGSVRLGDVPLADASVTLESLSSLVNVRARTDENGDFAGHLPEGLEWAATVRAESPRVQAALARVEVSEQDGEARVDIRLPDTTLRGSVVDEGGRGVGAWVTYISASEIVHSQFRTDEAGRFAIRGLPHGEYLLSATALTNGATSRAEKVLLSEGFGAAEVRLVVGARTVVRGTVVGVSGPLPRVQVLAFPRFADGSLDPLDSAQTSSGPDGRFELDVPARARSLDVVMMAPGRTLDAAVVPLPARDPVSLGVGEVGGTLHLSWRDPLDLRDLRLASPSLTLRGAALDFGLLRLWAGRHGAAFSSPATEALIPQLAAGHWRVCFPPPGRTVAEEMASPSRRCAEGDLLPGGELTLREP